MERIEGGWAELDRLEAGVDDPADPGPAGGDWSLKDHLAT